MQDAHPVPRKVQDATLYRSVQSDSGHHKTNGRSPEGICHEEGGEKAPENLVDFRRAFLGLREERDMPKPNANEGPVENDRFRTKDQE